MRIYLKVKPGGTNPPDAFQPGTEITFTDEDGGQVAVNFRSVLALEEAARVLADMVGEEYARIHSERARHDHRTEEFRRDDYEWPEDAEVAS